MNLELSSKERDVLVDVLKQRLGEMREQVYHAEAHKFKDELKQRKATMEEVLNKLSDAKARNALYH